MPTVNIHCKHCGGSMQVGLEIKDPAQVAQAIIERGAVAAEDLGEIERPDACGACGAAVELDPGETFGADPEARKETGR